MPNYPRILSIQTFNAWNIGQHTWPPGNDNRKNWRRFPWTIRWVQLSGNSREALLVSDVIWSYIPRWLCEKAWIAEYEEKENRAVTAKQIRVPSKTRYIILD
jgi:hypothetical protein